MQRTNATIITKLHKRTKDWWSVKASQSKESKTLGCILCKQIREKQDNTIEMHMGKKTRRKDMNEVTKSQYSHAKSIVICNPTLNIFETSPSTSPWHSEAYMKFKYFTCLCPLEPRCGVAEVMKLIGSSPAIFPLIILLTGDLFDSSPSHTPFSSTDCLSKSSRYSKAIAYRATKPPSEWPTKEIFWSVEWCSTTDITCKWIRITVLQLQIIEAI